MIKLIHNVNKYACCLRILIENEVLSTQKLS